MLGYQDEDNDGLFEEDADPDKKDVEYTGNEGTNVQHWYYTSAIVLWPREFTMSIQCSAGFEGAAATALRRAQAGEPDARQAFKEVVAYAKAHPRKSVPSCGTLLNTAVVFKSVDQTVEALRLLAITMPAEGPSYSYSNRYTSSPAGASGITCPTEVAKAVSTLGWTALGDAIVSIAKVQPIKHVAKALALLESLKRTNTPKEGTDALVSAIATSTVPQMPHASSDAAKAVVQMVFGHDVCTDKREPCITACANLPADTIANVLLNGALPSPTLTTMKPHFSSIAQAYGQSPKILYSISPSFCQPHQLHQPHHPITPIRPRQKSRRPSPRQQHSLHDMATVTGTAPPYGHRRPPRSSLGSLIKRTLPSTTKRLMPSSRLRWSALTWRCVCVAWSINT